MLICQLRNNGKPAHMRFSTYVTHHQEWVCHLDSRHLNITIASLTNQENVEAIFSHQPKQHQAKYALEKEEDEADGTYAAIIKNQRDSKCAQDWKEASDPNSHPKASLTLLIVIAIAHTETTINIAWAETTMTTVKTTTQAEIAIMTTKAAAMQTKFITVIGMTIIVTREAKEVAVAMTGKKEIAIMLVTKASCTIWRKSTVDLAPNLRVATA
eukprot:15349035-Ditylum_brightwellii.AAC.1